MADVSSGVSRDQRAALVVGPSWVGDMVMAQALFRVMAREDPHRAIDVLAPGWSLPVVARMPEIRAGIASQTRHGEVNLASRRAIAAQIRGTYQHALVLPRSFKAALIPWLAGVPRRTGYRGEMRFGLINDMRGFDGTVLDQTVKRFVALSDSARDSLDATLSNMPSPALDSDPQNQHRLLDSLQLSDERPIVAMMPGAEYGPAKCWPLAHFRELAATLAADGYAVWVLGSEKDAAAGAEIATAGHAQNLCGRTSLADVIDLLALCEQAVSNDSGLMHIAAAVGCHVHGIYGSSSPGFTPPLTERRDIHYLALDCSPCFERTCPLEHLNCLQQITPRQLAASIQEAANKSR